MAVTAVCVYEILPQSVKFSAKDGQPYLSLIWVALAFDCAQGRRCRRCRSECKLFVPTLTIGSMRLVYDLY